MSLRFYSNMEINEAIHQAVKQSVTSPSGEKFVPSVIENLRQISPQLDPATAHNPAEQLVSTLLRPDLPSEERKPAIKAALNDAQHVALNTLGQANLINASLVESQAGSISQEIIESIVSIAATFPKTVEQNPARNIMMDVLNPQKKSVEDQIQAATVVADIFKPFLVNRLLDLNIYETQNTQEKANLLVSDLHLLRQFYDSIKYVIEYIQEGTSTIDQKDLSTHLYAIGPVFAKLVQAFASSTSTSSERGAEIATELKNVFQEGVAPPTEKEAAVIRQQMPVGLALEESINSASVAFIFRTRDDRGQEYATKVSRPGIEAAKERNIRVFSVITETLISFVQEHAADTPLATQLETVRKALPYFLKMAEGDIDQELDFGKQITAQKRAVTLFQKHPEIVVPTIYDQFSNDKNITMQIEMAEKIHKLPANPKILKNIFTFCFISLHHRFWHSDLHAGNLKGRPDGSIVVYDWGQNFDIPKDFFKNMGSYLFALARKNPAATAKAYCKIQNTHENLLDESTVSALAQEVFNEQKQDKSKKRGVIGQVIKTQEQLALLLAFRHQSAIDSRYLAFMKSILSLSSIVNSELAKPEYSGKLAKVRKLTQAFAGAIKDSFFTA